MRFQNVEGVIVLRAALRGVAGEDTSGAFVLDTGAGFLALDNSLGLRLGLTDSVSERSIGVAARPLPRLMLGSITSDQVGPVLLFESEILSRVTDQPVLGLIGYNVIRDRVLWIDYQAETLAMIPAGPDVILQDTEAIADSRRLLRGLISGDAVPVRFRMAGDGKVLLPARVTPRRGGNVTPWLTMILDTGASKCVVFEDVVEPLAAVSRWRPQVRGLRAPTLAGVSGARLSVARRVELRGAARTAVAEGVEMALLRSAIARQLEQAAGEPIHGLLGYSFLQRFRMACDYPRQVLWLDPVPGAERDPAGKRGHVGIQIEQSGGRVRVVSLAESFPGERAGIAVGDQVLLLDGSPASSMSPIAIGRLLEGAPGTWLTITLRRGELERTYRLRRKSLY
jgi:hypothetical protein